MSAQHEHIKRIVYELLNNRKKTHIRYWSYIEERQKETGEVLFFWW